MGNIDSAGRLVVGDFKYLPREHPDASRYLLKKGDVLFNRTNSAELVGKTAVYQGKPDECVFASYLIRVRLKDECAPEYLSYVTNSAYGRRWIKSVVSQQVGQANVSGGKFKRFAFRLPPRDYQDAVTDIAESRLSIIYQLELELENHRRRAARLRESLLALKFPGAIDFEEGLRNE